MYLTQQDTEAIFAYELQTLSEFLFHTWSKQQKIVRVRRVLTWARRKPFSSRQRQPQNRRECDLIIFVHVFYMSATELNHQEEPF